MGFAFTGLSAPLTLLGRGRAVVVIDRGHPAKARAHVINGGQIGSNNQNFRVKRLIEFCGEKATVLLREGTHVLDYIEQLITAEKIDCHFRCCGRFRGPSVPSITRRWLTIWRT